MNAPGALCESHPEVESLALHFKFDGRGQRETPVADARGIVRIICAGGLARVYLARADGFVSYCCDDRVQRL